MFESDGQGKENIKLGFDLNLRAKNMVKSQCTPFMYRLNGKICSRQQISDEQTGERTGGRKNEWKE